MYLYDAQPSGHENVAAQWLLLARLLCSIVTVTNAAAGQAYMLASAFERRAAAILRLARPAFRLLMLSKETVEWQNHKTLRHIVFPGPYEKPVVMRTDGAKQIAAATVVRALVKFIFGHCGHPLPSLSLHAGQSVYMLPPFAFPPR
jgi:hypothetical protein